MALPALARVPEDPALLFPPSPLSLTPRRGRGRADALMTLLRPAGVSYLLQGTENLPVPSAVRGTLNSPPVLLLISKTNKTPGTDPEAQSRSIGDLTVFLTLPACQLMMLVSAFLGGSTAQDGRDQWNIPRRWPDISVFSV